MEKQNQQINPSEELQLRTLRELSLDAFLESECFDRMDVYCDVLIRKIITDAYRFKSFSQIEQIYDGVRCLDEFEVYMQSVTTAIIKSHEEGFECGRRSKAPFSVMKPLPAAETARYLA